MCEETKLMDEQMEQAKRSFEENVKDVDQDDVEYASKKGQSILNKFANNPPKALLKLWEDIKLMIGLITDYVKKDYKQCPWSTIAAVTGAVIYFISPIDVIPDFIPVVGFIDDALVISLALNFIGGDLEKYKEWKEKAV